MVQLGMVLKMEPLLWNATISVAMGTVFAGAFYVFSKALTRLNLNYGTKTANRGVVKFTPPKNNATSENITQTKSYVKGCNRALKDGALSSTGRVSTKGKLRLEVSKSAKAERTAAAGTPYRGEVGHVPDTTWTGSALPYSWLDLNKSVNASLGRQALKYPIGYKPTKFVFESPFTNITKLPSIWSSYLSSIVNNLITE